MSTDPTAEHIDAVACVIGYGDVPAHRTRARTLLTTASADAHAALAASLPAEVMLAALVDRGMLTEFQTDARLNEDGSLTTDAYIEHCNVKARQFVTSWEVAP